MEKDLNLEQEPILKLFLRYFFPAVAGMLMMSLNIVLDGIFVGQGIGREGLASVNIVFPIFMFFIAIGLCIGVGGATVISLKLGEKSYKEANIIFTQSIILVSIISVVVYIFGNLFLEKIVMFLGANENIMDYAKDYLSILLNFSLVIIVGDALSCFVRNDGNPGLAMYSLIYGAITNVVLNYVFIFEFNWALKGAALATGIGHVITMAILVLHFLQKRGKLRVCFEKFNKDNVVRIIRNGIPTFITEISTGIVALLFNLVLMKVAKEIGVSAYSIINYINALAIMVFIGISQAIQPIISYSYGAKDLNRVREVNQLAVKLAFVLGLCFFGIGLFGGKSIVRLFNGTDQALIELTTSAIKIYFISYLFMGVNLVIATYFQSIEKVEFSTTISLLRSFFFIIVGLYVLPKIFYLNGIWLTVPLAEFLTIIICILIFKCDTGDGSDCRKFVS